MIERFNAEHKRGVVPPDDSKDRVDMRAVIDDSSLLVYMLGLALTETADKRVVPPVPTGTGGLHSVIIKNARPVGDFGGRTHCAVHSVSRLTPSHTFIMDLSTHRTV